jgi:hypothetical protein
MSYIHLSGRDLAEKLNRGMAQIHAWRIDMLTAADAHAAIGTVQ